MQPWSNDHYESEPLDSSHIPRARMGRQPYPSNYEETQTEPSAPYFDGSSPHYHSQPPAQDPSSYNPQTGHYQAPTSGEAPPPPPPHGDNSYYTRGGAADYSQEPNPTYARNQSTYPHPGPEGYVREPSSAMSGSPRGDTGRNPGRLPPPPSRSTQAGAYAGGGYMYDGYARGGNSPMRSTTSSLHNYGPGSDPYGDDPYGYSSSNRSVDRRLGEVNPNEIEDDGDDGLHYPRYNQRNSMLSSGTSDRGVRPAVAAGTAAAAGVAVGGMFAKSGAQGRPVEYDLTATDKEREEWKKHEGMSKRKKTIIIFAVLFVIIGAIIGGVVGGMVVKTQKDSGDSNSGDSAKEDLEKSGELDKDSDEIKELMNNPDLHRVFLGMNYTPMNSQYPDCIHNPPSQNNVTRDVAVLSQLTNRIRTYGTDCNQTAMVIEAINRLDLKGDMKIWMGVWQDKNATTNERQLDEMYKILEDYGDEHFEGLIVANEILFREEMTITELGNVLQEVRSELGRLNLDLPVATSDLGDDWTAPLADTSDYLMSNIHPFFSGVTAEQAAWWTMDFFEKNNGAFFKTTGGVPDKKRNVISETGWPTGGGTNCGGAASCEEGSVASVQGLNTFMNDWICPALKNGTNYFWFSAFDEPWKIRFNEEGKEWEDKWGIMDVNRNLKDGVKIPDCGGQTIS